MKRSSSLYTGALVALLFAGAWARADFIEWSFNFSPVGATTLLSDTSPDSKIILSNESPGTAAGPSDIVATNIDVASNAPRGTPDMFGTSGHFVLKLNLKDTASGSATDLFFAGKFSGALSSKSSDLDVEFTEDAGAGILTAYDVILGDNRYSVTIGPYSPPGPPDQNTLGSIAAHVEVEAVDVQKAPEPSTMILGCMGLGSLGLAAWRKRRMQKVAA